MSHIQHIDGSTRADAAVLGGKGAGLAYLASLGIRIPPAFVITAEGFHRGLGEPLVREVASRLAAIASDAGQAELDARTADIRRLIIHGTQDHPLTAEVARALSELGQRAGVQDLCVAVRSSSVAEDAAERSFAGGHDTFLWVSGADALDMRIRECWASLATARAVAYRAGSVEGLAMAVVVQQMAPARAGGVMMTLNPVNGDRSKVTIESVWGLGEPLVSGEATPDRFVVDKVTGEVVRREIADKAVRTVRNPETGRGIAAQPVADDERRVASLNDEAISELVRVARLVERDAGVPQDIEFAVLDGRGPESVLLLQCRPETVWSRRRREPIGAPGRSAMDIVLATLARRPVR